MRTFRVVESKTGKYYYGSYSPEYQEKLFNIGHHGCIGILLDEEIQTLNLKSNEMAIIVKTGTSVDGQTFYLLPEDLTVLQEVFGPLTFNLGVAHAFKEAESVPGT